MVEEIVTQAVFLHQLVRAEMADLTRELEIVPEMVFPQQQITAVAVEAVAEMVLTLPTQDQMLELVELEVVG